MNQPELQDSLRHSKKEPVTNREIVDRGVDMVLPDKESLLAEMSKKRLRLYLGIDPTSPDLHIGHSVPLRKLRQFQEAGHEVILLFGDFTGMIGDPSDKKAARVRLTPEQIDHNMKTYVEQASKVLDTSPRAKNRIGLKKNSEWLSKLSLKEIIDIQANFTVQQMMERSMFQARIHDKKPIWLHEFSYPWMQGYDAQAMDVDIEVGGKDQLFNMLVGQALVRRYNKHEKWVVAGKMIEDPSGKKMGKTEGNIVNLTDWPEVKYEAIMTWPDTAIGVGFEMLTSIPMDLMYRVRDEVLPEVLTGKERINPMDLKEALAYRVVAELDGEEAAKYAESEFNRVKRENQLPKRLREAKVAKGTMISEILIRSGLVKDSKEAVTYLAEKAIFIDGKKVEKDIPWSGHEAVIQIGKRTIKNVRKISTG